MDLVDLDAYAAARQSNRRLERFSTHFAHGWLPTRKRMHMFRSAATNNCIWCHQTENQDHLFQCPHQAEWKEGFLERLDQHLKVSETEPIVKQEVIECVESWLNQTSCPCNCDQRRIGRHLLIRGYVASEWTRLQDQHYKDRREPSKRPLNGTSWTRKLILFMWDEAFQLWDKRNKEIFESDDSSSTQLFDLKQQVTDLYDLEDKVLAQDRINFALTLTERLKLHRFHLHNFVKIQGPIIRQSVKDAEKLAAANTRPLTDFFPRG